MVGIDMGTVHEAVRRFRPDEIHYLQFRLGQIYRILRFVQYFADPQFHSVDDVKCGPVGHRGEAT